MIIDLHRSMDAGPPILSAWRRHWRRLMVVFVLAVSLLSVVVLVGDARRLGSTLRAFDWWLMAPVLALALVNYALRFVKWEMYLRQLRVPRLPLRTSALVFLSGFSMTLTPGKVGEVIKCVFLRDLTGVPVARTSAAVAAERITDALAMLALAAIGLAQFAHGRTVLGAAAIGTVVLVLALRHPGMHDRVLRMAGRFSLTSRVVDPARAFLAASNRLLSTPLLAAALLVGIVSWAAECLALFLILIGLGLPASWHLLLVATFVHATSSILGAASMLPGGLGVADASMGGLLLVLIDGEVVTREIAVAAAILIRFATLWFALFLGLAALAILRRTTPAVAAGRRVDAMAGSAT